MSPRPEKRIQIEPDIMKAAYGFVQDAEETLRLRLTNEQFEQLVYDVAKHVQHVRSRVP